MFHDLLSGFGSAFQPEYLLLALLGVVIGTLTGVLPGIGPVGAISVLLGLSPAMGPTGSLILFAGVYYGSMYGGSTTSILLNIPGEANSVVTAIDGYEMTKRGRAGAALTVAAVGSFVAGTISILALAFATPVFGDLALKFGPPEYFALTVAGLLLLCILLTGPLWKSLTMVFLGLTLGAVGLDTLSAQARFTFDTIELSQGIGLVPLAMGFFGVAEVLSVAQQVRHGQVLRPKAPKLRDLLLTRDEARRSVGPIGRGSLLGFVMGLVPGPATLTSTFVSYVVEKRLSRRKEEFGKGAIEGVAGPESANNSAAAAAFIPLISLGIPFTPVMALVLSALLLNGITPGPQFINQHGDLFWTVIASMFIGNLALLVLNLPLVGLFTRILALPVYVLMPMILVFVLVGAYAASNTMWDVTVMVGAGLLGFVLTKYGFHMAPLLLAVVLGPTLENSMRVSLSISNGDLSTFVTRPISGAILTICAAVVVARVGWFLLRRTRPTAGSGSIGSPTPIAASEPDSAVRVLSERSDQR
jgi:putative tricarboxylic transport membrane protein